MMNRLSFAIDIATIGCSNQWMQFLQMYIALMFCNQVIADFAIIWLQQSKVVDIASEYLPNYTLNIGKLFDAQ